MDYNCNYNYIYKIRKQSGEKVAKEILIAAGSYKL